MTAPIKDPIIIQDDIGFIREDFQIKFMDLKQGRITGDICIEATPKQFPILYDMFCTFRYKQYQNRDKNIICYELGVPAEYFAITFNDPEFETQHTLSVSLKH